VGENSLARAGATQDEDRWTREAVRLHRRYQVEIVQAYGLCPWADRATAEGRVRERVILAATAEGAVAPSLDAITAWMADQAVDVAFLVYPRLAMRRVAFHDFAACVRDADATRHVLGQVPFVSAAFHPEAEPDTADPERLIPFLRRTPDPTLQLLRASTLDGIRSGASQGTQFLDIKSLEAALSGTGQPPLRERIARANLVTALHVGIEEMGGRMDDIRRDREETYAALKPPLVPPHASRRGRGAGV
jgi:hypothetical protein